MGFKRYRVYCETDNQYEYVISNAPPTECPIDSGHTLRSGSTCCMGEIEVIAASETAAVALTLDEQKQLRLKEIDNKTQELIAQGFTFDSESFSMSSLAQNNWVGLKQAAQNDLISYPFGISTKDDGEYELTSKTEVTNFYVTGLEVKIGHLSTGRALKLQIKNATTQAELDAVVDNR